MVDGLTQPRRVDLVRVAVNGQVLDVTNFLEDHPGGVKALLIQAGKGKLTGRSSSLLWRELIGALGCLFFAFAECSEEFNM